MNRELSARLDLLRFPLIVSVVFIHSQIGTIRFSDSPSFIQAGYIGGLVQTTFSEILRCTAVPTFFLLSGFLFCQTFEPTYVSYFRKLRTRFRTLIVPFLFWNTFVLLFLFIAKQQPVLTPFFTGGSWAFPEGGALGLVDAAIGVTRRPILYPFWFLRDLIVLVLISPVLWYLARRFPLIGLAACAFAWVYQTRTPLPVLHHHAPLLFFYVGSLIAVYKLDPLEISRFRRVLVFLFFAVVFVSILLNTAQAPPMTRLRFEKAASFITILAFWSIITSIEGKTRQVIAVLSGLSFFVYATHEPTLIILTKLLYRFHPPSNDLQLLIYYFAIPSATVIFTATAGILLRTCATGFYGVITGGRGKGRIETSSGTAF